MLVVVLVYAVIASTDAGYRYCYGNVTDLNPTGQRYGGVKASELDVKNDLLALNRLKSCYQQVADHNCIQASVIAALASRSSRGGELIRYTAGMGPTGAYGILQFMSMEQLLPCQYDGFQSIGSQHSVSLNSGLTDRRVDIGSVFLRVPFQNRRIKEGSVELPFPSLIIHVQTRQPYWSKAQTLQGGVAAYSFGVRNVQTWSRLDVGSPNNDFSNDVIARAQYLDQLGWN